MSAASQDADGLAFSWLLTAKQDLYLGPPPINAGGVTVKPPGIAQSWGVFFDADQVELRKIPVEFSIRGPVKQRTSVRATLPYSAVLLQQTVKIVLIDKDGATPPQLAPPQPGIVWDTSAS